MSKVAIITDTHFGSRSDSLAFNEYFLKFFDKVFFPYIEQNKITDVVHLGDVFDRRKYVNFHILSEAKNKIFARFQKLGICVDIIIGNHDTYWKNTNDVNSPDLLLGDVSNLRVYDRPIEMGFGNLKVLYVPWITDENTPEVLKAIEDSNASICMGHFELNGYQVTPGMYHDHGMSPEVLQKFDMVLSGHFHTRQSKDNIHYLGCPYQINYSDLNEVKGFHILDTDTLELEFIPNPYQMFHKILYDDKGLSFDGAVGSKDFTQYENGYVKVVVVNKTNSHWFERFMERLHAVNPLDIKIFEDYSTTFEIDAPTDVQMLSNDTLSVLDNSIDALTSHMDKDQLKLLMKEVYVEAQNVEL